MQIDFSLLVMKKNLIIFIINQQWRNQEGGGNGQLPISFF